MNSYRITTADDDYCGVEITSVGPNAYALTGIETGESLGVALSDVEAIQRAGEYLVTYGTDGLADYVDPETDDVVSVDWSATVRQGQEMINGPQDYLYSLATALDEDEDN